MTEDAGRKPFWQMNWLRVLVGTLSSVIFLYLAVKDVPLGDVLQTLARANYGWVMAAVAVTVLGSWLRALRWMRLYHPLDKGLRVLPMWGISLIGQMLNIVFPWRVGEIARIVLVGEIEKRSKTQTLATLGVEKIFDTLMLFAILLGIPLFMTLPTWFEEPRALLIATSLVLFTLAIILVFSRDWLLELVEKIPARWHLQSLHSRAHLALTSLDVLKRWDVHLELQVLSILVWFLGAMTNYFSLLALDLQLLPAAFLLLAVLQVGGLVPSAPGRLGVFQALCILTLSIFSIDKSVSLSYGILLYLVAFGPPAILGILFLWWDGVYLRRISAGAGASSRRIQESDWKPNPPA